MLVGFVLDYLGGTGGDTLGSIGDGRTWWDRYPDEKLVYAHWISRLGIQDSLDNDDEGGCGQD